MQKAKIFGEIYRDYIRQVSDLDLAARAETLGMTVSGENACIPVFNRLYRVGPDGVENDEGKRPDHNVSVVLCKYLILCPDTEPKGTEWIAYRGFADAAPFVGGYTDRVEHLLARTFSGNLHGLSTAAARLGGVDPGLGLSYDLIRRFQALPKIPLLLLFNDAEEGFPADCKVLLEQRAEKYLDMECLAILGMMLAHYLALEAKDILRQK